MQSAYLSWRTLELLLFVITGLFRPSLQSLNIHRARKDLTAFSEKDPMSEAFIGMNFEENPSSIEDVQVIEETYLHKNYAAIENNTVLLYSRNEAVVYALLSAGLVGLTGILPLILLPLQDGNQIKDEAGALKLKRLLSFAVGGLLGDVFLHLLPESWENLEKSNSGPWPVVFNGLWTLVGLISFCLLEKLFPDPLVDANNNVDDTKHSTYDEVNGYDVHGKNHVATLQKNGITTRKNGYSQNGKILLNGGKEKSLSKPMPRIKTSGYLNLLANCIDNFTHGLAVAGSYLVSQRVGILTTLAILLHEIPHEVGDFAILLRAGFTRWQAAKLQILTASGAVLGAMFAFAADSAKSAGDQVAWILPFTSGGFIYVALCTVVPDILKETSPRESIIQLFFILLAISIMHAVSFVG